MNTWHRCDHTDTEQIRHAHHCIASLVIDPVRLPDDEITCGHTVQSSYEMHGSCSMALCARLAHVPIW